MTLCTLQASGCESTTPSARIPKEFRNSLGIGQQEVKLAKGAGIHRLTVADDLRVNSPKCVHHLLGL